MFEMHNNKHCLNDMLVGLHICKTLSKYGIPAEMANSEPSWKPANKRSWILKTDISICAPEPGLIYKWAAIEINSPPFYFSEAA